jgi:hypothetical protein
MLFGRVLAGFCSVILLFRFAIHNQHPPVAKRGAGEFELRVCFSPFSATANSWR